MQSSIKLVYILKVFVTLSLLLIPTPIYAISTPTLISPINNSEVSSTELNWSPPSETIHNSNPYIVVIDDNQEFDSPKESRQPDTKYKPKLDPGIWFWRVKVRDPDGKWSEWTPSWKFTLSTTPSPTPTSAPSPTLIQLETIPQSMINPTPSPTSKTSTFNISQPPSSIDSTQQFQINIDLKNLTPNSKYYLKGAFKKPDSSNYFGKTKVSNSWVANSSSYSNQYYLTTDSSGNWAGSIELLPDPDDSGFTGTGKYIFKVARYDANGGGLTWSSEYIVSITSATTQSSTAAAKSTPTSTPKTTSTPIAQTTTKPITAPQSVAINTQSQEKEQTPQNSPQIAGLSTDAPTPTPMTSQVAGKKLFNWYIIGGMFLIIGSTSSLVITLKTNYKKSYGPNY